MGRVVAIKVLNAPDDPDLVRRFEAEATMAANLHHKNIVTVHEFGEENGAPYLVMEFLEGTNLHDLIKQCAPLALHEKLWIMSEVAEGLHCAHLQGVIHRDVKPANIMLLTDGSVKIMDFGIARVARESSTRLTQAGLMIGTLLYMAPEQFNGTSDALTDIFAYGLTFYELLTGKHPFSGPDPAAIMYRVMNSEPVALRSLVPDCPEYVERIVNRTIAKSRGARYTSLEDVVVDTKPILLDLRRQHAGELFARAGKLMESDQLDAAQASVRKALELDPWHGEARQLRSRIEETINRRELLDRALGLLDRAEQALGQREFPEASESLGEVRLMALDDPRVIARLEKGSAQIERTKNSSRLLDSAKEELRKEQLTEAFRSVSEVLADDPGNRTGQLLLQKIQQQMGSRESQRKLQEDIARVESLLQIGEFDQALGLLADLEAKAPANKEVAALRVRAETQKAEEARAHRLSEGIAKVRTLLKNRQFDRAVSGIGALLLDFPGNSELAALQRHALEQVAAQKRAEELEKLKADALAWIEKREYDRAISAIETGVLVLGGGGDLTGLLQSAVAGKAAQERERAILSIAEETRKLRQQGKFDEAIRAIERAMQRWGSAPELSDLLKEVSNEREAKERQRRLHDAIARAGSLLDQKKPEAAAVLLREAAARDGEDPEVRRLLGVSESQLRDRLRAEQVSAIREAANELTRNKRWQEALTKLDEGLRSFPQEPSLIAARASVVLAAANENLEQALLAALSRVQSLQQEDRLAEAAALLEKSLRDFGQDARLLEARRVLSKTIAERKRAEATPSVIDEARPLLQKGQFDEAVRLLEGAGVQYPGNPEVAKLLAEAMSARDARQKERAIGDALARAADLIQGSEFGAGISLLEQVLRTYPDSRELREAVARTKVRRDEADRQLEAGQLGQLIESARTEGDWSRALASVSAGLERYPGDADLVRLKQTAEEGKHRCEMERIETSVLNALQSGNLSLASEILAEARTRWPGEQQLRKLQDKLAIGRADESVTRAKQLLQSGQYDEAEKLAKQALTYRPGLSAATDLLNELAALRAVRTNEEKAGDSTVPPIPSISWFRIIAVGTALGMIAFAALVFLTRTVQKPKLKEATIVSKEAEAMKIIDIAESLSANAGTAYSRTFRTSGGSGPISWAIAEGSLPSGLSLDPQTGIIGGTPNKSGAYSFVIQAKDEGGRIAQQPWTITIDSPLKAQPPVMPKQAKPEDRAKTKAGPAPSPVKVESPKPLPPTPQPAKDVPSPCKAATFVLKGYKGDLTSSQFTWSGPLPNGGEVEITNAQPSFGRTRGDFLPRGLPVRIHVVPESVSILEGPSANNCWHPRLRLRNNGEAASAITIKWDVYQP